MDLCVTFCKLMILNSLTYFAYYPDNYEIYCQLDTLKLIKLGFQSTGSKVEMIKKLAKFYFSDFHKSTGSKERRPSRVFDILVCENTVLENYYGSVYK